MHLTRITLHLSEFLAFHVGAHDASPIRMDGTQKRFVYILRSDVDPERHYVGIASNPKQRLNWHNDGPSGYTVAHRPWSIVVSMEFPTEREARRFEGYLKSGSGRAFTKRHFASHD